MDSLNYLQEKLTHLQQKYSHHPRYCALRMLISSFYAIIMQYNKNVYPIDIRKDNSPEIIIVFDIKGGLGDLLLACNYIFHFYKYVDDVPIKLKICYRSLSLLNEFCSNLPGVIEFGVNINKVKGNLKIELNRFPHILSGDVNRIAKYSLKLKRIFAVWHNFYVHNRKLFDYMPQMDGLGNEYSQILGAKRINQADIGGILSFGEGYDAPVPYPNENEEKEILEKFGLSNRQFITIQRGQSIIVNSLINTKLWNPEKYSELLRLLKLRYPSLTFVQLGCDRVGFNDKFQFVDLDLLGKTNLREVKVMLKHAKLHIDSEGGLVHLRHALKGGPSTVLFGPTSPKVYGYSENLNLRSSICSNPCEWVTNDWQERCARRKNKNICMLSLTPDIVFKEIEKFVRDNNIFVH